MPLCLGMLSVSPQSRDGHRAQLGKDSYLLTEVFQSPGLEGGGGQGDFQAGRGVTGQLCSSQKQHKCSELFLGLAESFPWLEGDLAVDMSGLSSHAAEE